MLDKQVLQYNVVPDYGYIVIHTRDTNVINVENNLKLSSHPKDHMCHTHFVLD